MENSPCRKLRVLNLRRLISEYTVIRPESSRLSVRRIKPSRHAGLTCPTERHACKFQRLALAAMLGCLAGDMAPAVDGFVGKADPSRSPRGPTPK